MHGRSRTKWIERKPIARGTTSILSWATKEGLIDANPVTITNRWDETPRERVLSDDELQIIWRALGDDDYSTVVKVLMFTGQH